ncbi:hypothetical protein [Simonsiella muelleri]|uniref:hypothetical protein n=1 Tax=Simonsiella muelleri TaxID=72 RepID=UPI0028D82E95|nr:hypothetical protein [Simonsiella muelleri]
MAFANFTRVDEKSSKSKAPFETKASEMDFKTIYTSKPKTIKVVKKFGFRAKIG